MPSGSELDAGQACSHDGAAWTCRLARGLAVRAVATYDSSSEGVFLKSIEISPASGAIERQSLVIEDRLARLEPYHVTVGDMDGDGYRDFMVARQFGHANNPGNYTWRLDPSRRRFVLDSLLSEETNVQPDSVGCVATSGFLGRNDTVESRYCLRSGGWVKLWSRVTTTDDNEVQTTREYRLESDSLRLVKIDTVRG